MKPESNSAQLSNQDPSQVFVAHGNLSNTDCQRPIGTSIESQQVRNLDAEFANMYAHTSQVEPGFAVYKGLLDGKEHSKLGDNPR